MAATNNYSNTGLLPSTMLEPFGAKALQYGIGQLGTPINSQALSPQVAGQSAFQQKAAQGLADMSGLGNVQRDASGQVTGFTGGTGVSSYQPYLTAGAGFNQSAANLSDPSQDYKSFMSPYQQQVIDSTMADFDRQSQIGQQSVSDSAYASGAFGGGREGVQQAEYQSSSDRNRAAVLAGLYGQGYEQAQGYRQQAMDNQLGLGALQNQMAQFVPGLESQRVASLEALGGQDQLLEQNKLNAITTANQTAYQLPMQRITEYANLYGTVAGAMPGNQAGPGFQSNPFYNAVGGAANVIGAFGAATQAPQAPAPSANVTGGYTGYGGGYGRQDPYSGQFATGGIAGLRRSSRAYRRGGRVGYGTGGIVSNVQ